jgi:hypothetical protein
MRHIGTIIEKQQAERFVHFLASQHTEAELRPLLELPVTHIYSFVRETVA